MFLRHYVSIIIEAKHLLLDSYPGRSSPLHFHDNTTVWTTRTSNIAMSHVTSSTSLKSQLLLYEDLPPSYDTLDFTEVNLNDRW